MAWFRLVWMTLIHELAGVRLLNGNGRMMNWQDDEVPFDASHSSCSVLAFAAPMASVMYRL